MARGKRGSRCSRFMSRSWTTSRCPGGPCLSESPTHIADLGMCWSLAAHYRLRHCALGADPLGTMGLWRGLRRAKCVIDWRSCFRWGLLEVRSQDPLGNMRQGPRCPTCAQQRTAWFVCSNSCENQSFKIFWLRSHRPGRERHRSGLRPPYRAFPVCRSGQSAARTWYCSFT